MHAFGMNLVREPDAGNPHVRFDERGAETEWLVNWSSESEVRKFGHLRHQLSRKRCHESLNGLANDQEEAGTALDHAQQLPSGRTSGPCATRPRPAALSYAAFFNATIGRCRRPARCARLAFPVCPRAVVRASRARAMAWTAAERTRRGQFLGSGRGGAVCLAMKVLIMNLERLSGQAGDNARGRLDLAEVGAY